MSKIFETPMSGGTINDAARLAIDYAKQEGEGILLSFNQLLITVHENSHHQDVADKYYLMARLKRAEVGYKDGWLSKWECIP